MKLTEGYKNIEFYLLLLKMRQQDNFNIITG